MAVTLTDVEILDLILEPKPLPPEYRSRMTTKPKRGHRERELDVQGGNAHSFRVILRESLINPLDFSVILAWMPTQSTVLFRLRRYKWQEPRAYERSGGAPLLRLPRARGDGTLPGVRSARRRLRGAYRAVSGFSGGCSPLDCGVRVRITDE